MQDDRTETRAATYGRVSTGKQLEGVSLSEQQREARERCDHEGWRVVGAYADEGVSAGKERPELERMLVDAKANMFDVLVVRELDRVGRSLIDLNRIVTALDAAGIRIVTLRGQSIDVTTAEGRFQFNVLASVAEYERAKIAERVSGTAAARAAEGHFPGGRFPPYGYRRESIPGARRKRLVVVPEEAEVVRRIFEETLAGRSTLEIVRDLNADGLRTQRGTLWPRVTVRRIVSSHVYAGLVEVKGDVHPGKHEAIVTPEQWKQARALLAARHASPGSGRGRVPTGTHVFTKGVLLCVCGEPLSPRTYKGGTGAYVCTGASERGNGCDFGPIPSERIDGPFLKAFNERYLDVDGTRRSLTRKAERDRVLAHEAAQAAERQLAKLEERQARVRTDYLDEAISARRYEEISDELDAQAEAARAEVQRVQARETEVNHRLDAADVEAGVLRKLAALHNAKAGRLRDAQTLAAVRAAVLTIFKTAQVVRLSPEEQGWQPVEDGYLEDVVQGDGLFLFLIPRADEDAPDLRALRATLRFDQSDARSACNTDISQDSLEALFEPIALVER